MSSNTPNLGLLKKDPLVDGNETFNIETMLNENWDKIDEAVGQVREDLGNIDVDIPEASLTEKGIVQLSSATNGTRENVAATEKAVAQAFHAGNERKAEVVAALVAIGVSASTSETWAQLIPKIAAVIRATGNATAADILAGKTASNANGPLNGSMPNREAVTLIPGKIDQAIPAGYHNGAGKVSGVYVNPEAVLAGTTIAGTPGTMPYRSVENNHMPGLESTVWAGDRFFIRPPHGYYSGSTWVTAAVPGLTPENIRNGVNVGNLTGTLKPNVSGIAQLSVNIPQWTSIGVGVTNIHDIITFPAGTSLAYHGMSTQDIIYVRTYQGWVHVSFEVVNNGNIFVIFSINNSTNQTFGFRNLSLNFPYNFFNYQAYGNTGNFGSYLSDSLNPGAVLNAAYPITLRMRVTGGPSSMYPNDYAVWALGPMTYA